MIPQVLEFDNTGNIYACGTFAKSSRCWRFNRSDLSLAQQFSGINGRMPVERDDRVVSLFTDR